MPSKYVIRDFAANEYYHVFNRGIEKRNIFRDEQDYNMFLYYLFVYLAPPDEVVTRYPKLTMRVRRNNLQNEIELHAFCLMPNHFHLLLKQKNEDAVKKLLKQVVNGYTRYFNTKYDRVGSLMQGRYKAVRITSDEILLHISRYIHLNPLIASLVTDLAKYKWSSYLTYIRKIYIPFVKTETILSQFPSQRDYVLFVGNQEGYARELDKIKHVILEEEA